MRKLTSTGRKPASTMRKLASTIKDKLDALAGEYDRRLGEIKGYSELSDPVRLDTARHALNIIAACLEGGDEAEFIQCIQTMVSEGVEQGLTAESLLQALTALEEILLPLVTTGEAAKFLWRAFSRARTIVSHQATEMLRESEQKFRQLVDRSPVGIFRTTPDGRIVEANPAFLRIVGYDSLEAINQIGVPSLYQDPADREQVLALLRQGPISGYETRFRRADGQIITVSITARQIYDEEGSPQFLEGIIEDITERKRAEDLLRIQRDLGIALGSTRSLTEALDRLLEAAFQIEEIDCGGVYLVDELTGELELVSHKGFSPRFVEHISHYDADAPQARLVMAGKPIYGVHSKVVPTMDKIRQREGLRALAILPVQYEGADRRPTVVAALNLASHTHDEIPIGARNAIEAIAAQIGTVIARGRAEEQIATFQALAENAVDAIAMGNLEGQQIYGNRATYELFGYDYEQEEMTGMPLVSFWPEEDVPILTERVLPQALAGSWSGEVRQQRKDGTLFDASLTVFPVRNEAGQVISMAAIIRDITERKRWQEQRTALLERRGRQVQTSTEIAQEIAAAPALDELLHRVVTLIKERFGYYHTQIFRHEPALGAVVLVTGYGEAGEKMMAEGHRLLVGRGAVGTAVATGQPVLATDVTQDADWVPNPHLPETKGELAVPITLRRAHNKGERRVEVLGILDVQSDTASALTEEDQILLEGLCGQIAIAIEDTRLHQEMEENLRELEYLSRAMSHEGWEAFRRKAGPTGYLFDQGDVTPAGDFWASEIGLTMERQTLVPPTADDRPAAVVPLSVHGEVIGALGVQDDPQRPLSPDDLALVESVSEQVALALESARLFEQTRSALAETEALYAGSERVVRTTTIDDVLQALIHSTALQRLDRASIAFFNRPWEDELPEEATVVATWERSGQESRTPVGTCYSLAQFPVIEIVTRSEPAIFRDIATDEHVGENLRTLLLDRLGMRSLILWPLIVGGQWIGFLTGQAGMVLEIDEGEVRQIASLADQAASVVQNQRLFEQAQQRAAELEEATSFLDSVIENIPTMLFVKDAEDLRFVRWNRAGEELVGFSREEMIGKNDYDFFTKEEADFFVAKDRQVLAGGKLVDIPEEPIQTADKGTRLLRTRKVPILGADGQPKYLLGISEDITERRAAEEALRVSEERFVLAMRGSNDGIWDWDIQNNSLYWSPRLKELLGYAEDELDVDFDTFDSLLHPDDREHTSAAIEAYLRDRELYEVEQRLRTKSGEYRWFLARGQAIWDETGQPLRMVGFTTDITERKQSEAEREQLLAELAATHRTYLRREWQDYLSRRETLRERGLLYDQAQVTPVPDLWRPEMGRVLAEGGLATTEGDGDGEGRTGLAIPIILRGQTVGILGVEDPDGARHWSEEDRALIEAVGRQLALALENARLLEETQQRATREQLTREITDKMRRATDMDTLMQTVVQETVAALGAPKAFVQLAVSPESSGGENAEKMQPPDEV